MQRLINNSGIYILELLAKKNFRLTHNKFNNPTLPKGYYYYIGSAQKNLTQRIDRHIRKKKKIYWHIDYITTLNNIIVKNVFILNDFEKKYECKVVDTLITKTKLSTIINGFGNSDCKLCESHLLYSKFPISYNHLCSLYQETVLFIPSSNDSF